MQSFRIVIHFNKLENFTPGIFCILKGAAFQQLRFEPAEERFHMRVIVRIVSVAHALQHFVTIEYLPEFSSCILSTTIRMNQQPRFYFPVVRCLFKRRANQRFSHMILLVPAYNFAGE